MDGEASRVTEQLGTKTGAWDGDGDGACAPHRQRLRRKNYFVFRYFQSPL